MQMICVLENVAFHGTGDGNVVDQAVVTREVDSNR